MNKVCSACGGQGCAVCEGGDQDAIFGGEEEVIMDTKVYIKSAMEHDTEHKRFALIEKFHADRYLAHDYLFKARTNHRSSTMTFSNYSTLQNSSALRKRLEAGLKVHSLKNTPYSQFYLKISNSQSLLVILMNGLVKDLLLLNTNSKAMNS